jgi:LacI family transcriptional regulator/LacI family repressor for deo operon, udp, cdd, tsx, nupC, and nupG
MSKIANLKEVARKAKVSIATVSRALNHPNKVEKSTLLRINKIVREINYKPNRVAQRLRIKDGHKKIIGLLVPDIQNPFYVDVIRGVEDYAYSRNCALLVSNFAQSKEKEKLYLEIMKSESVDGLIVAPFDENDEDVKSLVNEGMPIVCVDRGLSDISVDVIVVDNEKGAYDAVNLLIKKGHKRIAYIGGLPQIPTTHQRKNGYIKALENKKINVDEDLIRFGNSKQESGKDITKKLLKLNQPPTAIFTGNNLITLGALETIHAMKLRIPQDIAIVGFDDMPWAISLNPPLTAVKQPGYDIGKQAAGLLYQRILEPDKLTAKTMLNTELIVRNSC